MKVEVKLDPNISETTIKIYTKEITDEITDIMKNLNINKEENSLIAWQDKKAYILKYNDIDSIYSNQGKVYVKVDNKEYVSKNKLYEIEENIKERSFIRISNSEIINFDKVKNIDLSIIGTIELTFKSGYITYASRRNIKKIKEYLKI